MLESCCGPVDQDGMVSPDQFRQTAQADQHVGFGVTRYSNVYRTTFLRIFQ
jgi:hypothetical protein